MPDFIIEQTLFYFSLILVLFVPGYFLMLAVWGKDNSFDSLTKLVISFSTSIISVNFIMLFLGIAGVSINVFSILASIFIFIIFSITVYFFRKNKGIFHRKNFARDNTNGFKRSQTVIIILLLFLTVFIKTIFLSNTIFPTSTDLGHHMYWSKTITETGNLPIYEETNIISTGESISISQPEKIADFIIGEHLIFSAIVFISGADYISYFPSIVLFLINIASILAIFILTLEIFRNHSQKNNISILALLFIGPLFALASPQAKFVSGGVIGNILGNLMIPLILFFFIRALRKNESVSMAMGLFLSLGLLYIHHLSTFIFIYSFTFALILFLIFNFKKIHLHLISWFKTILSPSVLGVIIFGIIMVFFLYTPSYLNSSAVETAIGTPSKSTRTGLTFSQLYSSTGGGRVIFGLAGLLLIIVGRKRQEYGNIFLGGWALALLLMSLSPELLFVDIPSNRIGSYVSFPMTILSAFAFIVILGWTRNKTSSSGGFFLRSSFVAILFIIFISLSITGGYVDNSSSLSAGGNNERAVQTFEAATYLAPHIDNEDMVLKDHNYLVADSWIKLYFMNGYNNPLSRAYFKRYEDVTKKREQCTLLMISLPNSPEAEKCFQGTRTNFVMTNPVYDGPQFKKNKDFWKVYESDGVSIFHKKN